MRPVITHTHSKLQLHYIWPGMSDFVKDRISACHKCVARKSPINRHHPMGHVPVSGRFERVAMDVVNISQNTRRRTLSKIRRHALWQTLSWTSGYLDTGFPYFYTRTKGKSLIT